VPIGLCGPVVVTDLLVPMRITQELAHHRVVVFVGSGGVGKTTIASTFAAQRAMAGQRVLCLTIDPAKRLADSLGISYQGDDPQQVPAELFERYHLHCRGELWALMLDRKRTFDNLVAKLAGSPEKRARILANKFYQFISTSLAGTQEYMAVEKLLEVNDDGRFDQIVLDTPPTTNAFDFLEAPMRLVDAIDSPVPRWFVRMLEGDQPLGLLGRGAVYILRGLSTFTGMQLLKQIAEFVSDINDLFGGFRQRADRAYQMLQSSEMAYVLVTTATAQAAADTVFFTRKLHQYAIEPKAIVVNRLHPVLGDVSTDDGELESRLRVWLPDVERLDAPRLIQQMRAALAQSQTTAHAERQAVLRLSERTRGAVNLVEVPALEFDAHDLGSLARLSRYL
jgi:anion-transporting  ArsA/GET3 family ATPase